MIVTQLINLHTLDVYYNDITELPEELSQLTKLCILNANFNQIAKIPVELNKLTQLQYLEISNNKITELPVELSELHELRYLDVSNNNITNLPKEIGALRKLEELYLSFNKIENLPDGVRELTSLTVLGISSCNLKTLPLWIVSLNNLESLNVSYNCLTELPVAINALSNLSTLNLEHNKDLATLPLSMGDLENLTHLDITGTLVSIEMCNSILSSCQRKRVLECEERLPSTLKIWFDSSTQNLHEDKLNSLIDQFIKPEKITLYEWLIRLAKTNDFSRYQQQLAEIVCQMIVSLSNQKHKEFRSFFFDQAESNNSDCHDRAAMAFNELYVAWKIQSLDKDAPIKDKLNLIIGAARTLALRGILEGLGATQAEEGVEVFLYYESKLKKKLNLLTAIEDMSYAEIGKREFNEQKLILSIEATYWDHLFDMPLFKNITEKDADFQRLQEFERDIWHKNLENLDALKEITDQEYKEKVAEIKRGKEAAELQISKKWVEEILRNN